MTNPWVGYWQEHRLLTDTHARRNIGVFAAAAEPLLRWSPTAHVLDIGCGDAFLADVLKGRFASYTGLDVDVRSLERARRRGPDRTLLELKPERYTTLPAALPMKLFDVIVCLTVIQYYRSIDEVCALIRNVAPHAAPGARMLIADVPVAPGSVRDAVSALTFAAREGGVPDVLRFLARCALSDYARFRKRPGLLVIPEAQLSLIPGRCGFEGRVVADQLTELSTRRHLLIEFL